MPAVFFSENAPASTLSIMRWAFICDHNRTTLACITLSFTLHQHMYAPVQRCDLALLPGHNIRQILNRAGQMGQLFFQLLHHSVPIRRDGFVCPYQLCAGLSAPRACHPCQRNRASFGPTPGAVLALREATG